MPKFAQRHIAIIFHEQRMGALRNFAERVSIRAESYGGWPFHLFGVGPRTLEALAEAPIDGAIAVALLEDEAYIMEGLAELGIPAVHAGELHTGHGIHEISPPNHGIGALGARHLLDCGFRHFAFVCGRQRNCTVRREGFCHALAEAGYSEVSKFYYDYSSPQALGGFIASLPRPVGIMATDDPMGWSISQQAFALGIAIPHELAVVSIGNSDLWCNLATPPLSSIKFPAEAMGDQAAIMLHDLMEGRSAPLKIEVHSASIIERQSTATMHARSPEIASAVRFIRENFSRPITVAHVADHIGASLSTLERGVKEALGRTPHQELLRLRHAAAIDFLANSEIPMKLIARRCGFTDSKHFSAAFRAAHGLSPSEYREQQRG